MLCVFLFPLSLGVFRRARLVLCLGASTGIAAERGAGRDALLGPGGDQRPAASASGAAGAAVQGAGRSRPAAQQTATGSEEHLSVSLSLGVLCVCVCEWITPALAT